MGHRSARGRVAVRYPATGALKETLGVGATTVSSTDVIDHSDLIVLFGSNAANAQPVFLKYLYLAMQRGAKVAVVNPYREPAMEHYWVPSNLESVVFGTEITDEFLRLDPDAGRRREVLLLPAMTRYEQPGGGTETTTERRIIFSPYVPDPRGARNGSSRGSRPRRSARVRRCAGDPR